MDKNIAEQLNKAYEAFRQACMDRDSAVKELKQKTDSYEKQICEQQNQIVFLTSTVTKLNSQLASLSCNKEDSETRRNGTLLNLNADQLYEKLQLAMQREKLLKEQLEGESVKLKETEEESNLKEKKFESIIAIKEDEIRLLKKQLKEISEAQNSMPRIRNEKEAKNGKHASSRQQLSPGAFGTAVCERDELEAIFWGLKEEFHHIRTLAKAQTDQLSKFKLRREPVTEIPFSTPIQCTDEQADDLCNPWVKKDLNRGVPHFPSTIPRGMGQDEDENSVESLSQFNVKFPPIDNDAAFLESTPGIPCIVMTENMLPDQPFHRDLGDQDVSYSEVKCNMFEGDGADSSTSAAHNLPAASKAKPSAAHTNALVQNPLDNPLCFQVPYSYGFGATVFPDQDIPEIKLPSLEDNKSPAGVPQQPLWEPYHTQDNDVLALPSADSELDQTGICEFCQKVFPSSSTPEDFLRHLNSHFNLKS